MNLSKRKQVLIVAGLIAAFVIFIGVVLYIKTDKDIDYSKQTGNKTIIIDNQTRYKNGINKIVFSSIGTSTYVSLALNVENPDTYYHGVIRDNTFKKRNNLISFVLDIPKAKISWKITQNLDKNGYGVTDALIECVPKDLLIYPEAKNCIDRSNVEDVKNPEILQFAGITKVLPLSGSSYKVVYDANDQGGELVITTYTASGQQDARNALSSLGYNQDDYKVTYVDKSQ